MQTLASQNLKRQRVGGRTEHQPQQHANCYMEGLATPRSKTAAIKENMSEPEIIGKKHASDDPSMVNAKASRDIVIAISHNTFNNFSPPGLGSNASDQNNQMALENYQHPLPASTKETPGFGKLNNAMEQN